ncbi:Na(+)/H(+) exchange regulatory cofactor NHE-RF1 [Sceloporus undulatus]|uniref:Na(+)/H(+) exchange regulatory cofactor NHE-RF1 n=1 Tax=Sceloporus undulatus TaxID=8520 RepID=UPI001C4B4C5D|nr:Na(+)/H(+) exchange regulatory cofactor NHE-RF1 [Sceloporus undulatus]
MENSGGSPPSPPPPQPPSSLLPRLCCPEKGPNGYGFHLHGEKGKVGQFIRLVEPESPAEKSGLRAGDRLVEVNGENVEKESHQQVVNRIRGSPGSVRLLVVDAQTDQRLQELGLRCTEELLRGMPQEEPQQQDQEEKQQEEEKGKEAEEAEPKEPQAEEANHAAPLKELRPRLCQMKKGPNGYGFNLHSDKTKPGQYVRAVDPDSPAEASGLQPQDRIIEVNGVCMEGKQHADVVSAIRSGGDDTKLLVVDSLTDEFFKKCKVIPSEAHLKGPLPEPVANGDVEKENNRDDQPEPVPESPSSPVHVSTSPTLKEPHNELNSQEKEEKSSPAVDPLLDLDIPLAVAKERAHQKRTSKRAPQMDWSKKNELFSNL